MVKELKRIIAFVEQNENLMIPKSKFHPNILNATRNNPITGATIFELCAWHMLLIVESEKNKYTIAIDNNLIKGIPEAYIFFGEFIKTLRAYNEIYEDFEITYESTLNVDGPCGNISSPVRGAVSGSVKTIKIHGGNQGSVKSYAKILDEIDSISPEDYKKEKKEGLESKFGAEVRAGLKKDAKEAKNLLTKVSSAIKTKRYEGLKDIDVVIERVNEAVDGAIDIMNFNLAYMFRPFVNSYEMVYLARYVIADTGFDERIRLVITENTFEKGKFDPNTFPKRLSGQMDKLTEEDIYVKLLEDAERFRAKGHEIISSLSAAYILKQLDELGNDFEVQGTQYEGRTN